MRFIYLIPIVFFVSLIAGCTKEDEPEVPGTDPVTVTEAIIIDHRTVKLTAIPSEYITAARQKLHIAYSHTSHGSQLITGMSGLVSFKGSAYSWNNGGSDGALDLHDYAIEGDLGNPDRTTWASRTRTYLAANADVNVVMWSWCGQVTSASENDIKTYLSLMNDLEKDFPKVEVCLHDGTP